MHTYWITRGNKYYNHRTSDFGHRKDATVYTVDERNDPALKNPPFGGHWTLAHPITDEEAAETQRSREFVKTYSGSYGEQLFSGSKKTGAYR